jgi:hypothetical protein
MMMHGLANLKNGQGVRINIADEPYRERWVDEDGLPTEGSFVACPHVKMHLRMKV